MQEIVSKYFEKGFLLTPQAIDFLEKTNDDFDISSKDFIVDVQNFILKDSVTIIKNFQSKKSEVTTEDFVKFYTSKYEKMKDIIVSRLQKNFISLNKTDSLRSEVYVIGIVRDIKADGDKKIIDLEDMTTSIPVIFDGALTENVFVDDVIAVRAAGGGKVLFGKEIMFPDIPIRPPATGRGKALFVSDLYVNEAAGSDLDRFFSWIERSDVKNVFISGYSGDPKHMENLAKNNPGKTFFVVPAHKDGGEYPQLPLGFSEKNIVQLSNPSMVEINGIKILMAHNADQFVLKKRHMGKPTAITPEDYMVMEDVPDIVHFGYTRSPHISNYKSVTMVNSGSISGDFRPVVVDFSSRNAEFVKVE